MPTETKELESLSVIQDFVSHLPDFSNSKIEMVDGGVSTAVYRLKQNQEVFYLRLGDVAGNMSSEALAHKLMLEKGVLVPKVIQFEDSNSALNRSYMITSEIPGTRTDNDPQTSQEIVIEAGRQLAVINSIPVDGFGWIDRNKMNVEKMEGIFRSWEDFALDFNNLQFQLNSIAKMGAITSKNIERIKEHISANQNLISCPQAFLSHGDFDISHFFSDNGRYTGIIDFGDIRCCSPYHDLAHFYTYSRKNFDDLLSGYLGLAKPKDRLLDKIKFEALIFGIGKLSYMIEHFPVKFKQNHPAMLLINEVISE